MSSRAFRKLHGDQDIIIPGITNIDSQESDNENEEPDGKVEATGSKKNKKKGKVVNRFDLLTEDTQISEEEATQSVAASDTVDREKGKDITQSKGAVKKKKKKRKGGKDKTDFLDAKKEGSQIDDVDASILEVNAMLGELPSRPGAFSSDTQVTMDMRALLNVEHRHLNSGNEMKRIFGSRVVQSQQSRGRRQKRRVRQTWLVQPREEWRPIAKLGLCMNLLDTQHGCQYFTFEHSKEYQKVQFDFLNAVESFNPENIVSILNMHPYHIDSLIQLSEVCRMSEDMQMAAELIERALYCFESNFHPLFSLTQGNCRLDYRRTENRSLYLAMFKHLVIIGQRGCYRTAMEFCKLLLSLDPEGDALCVLLMIDFYALRAAEYDFLIRMYAEWEAHRNLSQLPNFGFSVPLAMYKQAMRDGNSTEKADAKLQDALLMFPGFLMPLLDKCNVNPDSKVTAHSFFDTNAQLQQPDALKQLIALYIGRCDSCWKEPDVIPWLEKNVNTVLSLVDSNDKRVKEYRSRYKSRYQGTPRNIFRHILLSEIKDASAALPPELANTPVMSYDPLPPKDSIVSYTRPGRPTRLQQDPSVFSSFFRSLLPHFNPQEEANLEGALGAAGGAENNNLHDGVNALMAAMRDLLSNIRMEAPPVENQHDGDDDDDNIADEEWD